MDFREIVEFLDLIKNPEKAEKIAAGFAAREEQLQALAKDIGDVSQANKKLELAEIRLAKATEEADQIVSTAKSQAAEIIAKASEEQAKAAEVLRNGQNALYQAKEEAARTKELLVQIQEQRKVMEKDLAKKEADLSRNLEAAAAKQLELDAKLAKFKEIVG